MTVKVFCQNFLDFQQSVMLFFWIFQIYDGIYTHKIINKKHIGEFFFRQMQSFTYKLECIQHSFSSTPFQRSLDKRSPRKHGKTPHNNRISKQGLDFDNGRHEGRRSWKENRRKKQTIWENLCEMIWTGINSIEKGEESKTRKDEMKRMLYKLLWFHKHQMKYHRFLIDYSPERVSTQPLELRDITVVFVWIELKRQ